MANNYYVDNACYFLTRTPSNNLTGLSDIEDKLATQAIILSTTLPSDVDTM